MPACNQQCHLPQLLLQRRPCQILCLELKTIKEFGHRFAGTCGLLEGTCILLHKGVAETLLGHVA